MDYPNYTNNQNDTGNPSITSYAPYTSPLASLQKESISINSWELWSVTRRMQKKYRCN